MADSEKLSKSENRDRSSSGGNTPQGDIDRRIQTYQRQLRRLASELSLAEARERREIASDLHDHIGQALAYISQKVTTLRGNSVFSGMEGDFGEIQSILNQTIRYTRDLTVEISPPILYELGLSAAIDWLAERASHRHGFKVKVSQSGKPREVAESIKVFIFKAIQELIANAAKHAQAASVTIKTEWRNDEIRIVLRDDGQGFDTASFDSGISKEECFGLFSIRERLSYAGGKFAIESAPGQGTTVTISTPYVIQPEVME